MVSKHETGTLVCKDHNRQWFGLVSKDSPLVGPLSGHSETSRRFVDSSTEDGMINIDNDS